MQVALRLHLDAGASSELVLLNISSIVATRPEPLASLYSMSRAAVLNLSHCVAKEYGRRNVRSVAVSPVSGSA
jgi:NAD(P)-dependent dehydrogenase (short-subunit alcohol dehydrogenase family)